MRKYSIIPVVVLAISAIAACTTKSSGMTGEALYKMHCAGCHPDGGNTIDAKKTLKKADREANGIRTAGDVAALVRNPKGGMPQFTKGVIPDADALKLGEYVIKTFN